MLILMVEDDEDVRTTTAELMRELGHQVIEAESAEQAMEVLRNSAIDVLVTDVGLPGASGDVFAAEARSMQPSLRIIFATGLDRIREPGAEENSPVLLRKPFTFESIEAALISVSQPAR